MRNRFFLAPGWRRPRLWRRLAARLFEAGRFFPKTAAFFGTPFLALGTALLLSGCGLEDYPYINPVHESRISRAFNDIATINLRSYEETLSFSNFVVFYRIYVSDQSIPSTTRDQYSAINAALNSDYNTISPYIDSETLVNSNMDSLFRGRGYKYLSLEEAEINAVLSSAGATIVFDFTSYKRPTMIKDGAVYTLKRSNGDGSFTPLPADRYFINSGDLWNPAYINANTNADVANKSGIAASSPRHTYAALFIAAVGIDPNTYSYIYSTPNLIHVFLLPEQWT